MFKSRRSSNLYKTSIAFCTQLAATGYRFLRVDLTSSELSCSTSLQRHFEELRRRIERAYGFRIEFFKLKTSEGHGILHCIFACKTGRSFYIDHEWLKIQWNDIHRASIVYVKRLRPTEADFKRIAGYLADQHHDDKIVRVSWSMKCLSFPITKTFKKLYRIFYQKCHSATFHDFIMAWQDLLVHLRCVLDGVVLAVLGR